LRSSARCGMLGGKRGNMQIQEVETMTLREKLAITGRAFELLDARGTRRGFPVP